MGHIFGWLISEGKEEKYVLIQISSHLQNKNDLSTEGSGTVSVFSECDMGVGWLINFWGILVSKRKIAQGFLWSKQCLRLHFLIIF